MLISIDRSKFSLVGKVNAATVANNYRVSFPNIKLSSVVSIVVEWLKCLWLKFTDNKDIFTVCQEMKPKGTSTDAVG